MRNVRPTSLTSLDSGHATQYTQSITSSAHTANSRGGPMRATVRPRGITEHIPSTLCTVSSNNSATRTYSRHRSRTPSGGPYSDGDASQYHHDGSNISSCSSSLARKRSQSMEALNTQKEGDNDTNRSYHSHSSAHTVSTGGCTTTTVLSARSNSNTVGREGAKRQPSSYGGKLRAVYDCDKENESVTMTRKAASESGSVSGGWQRGQVRPAAGGSSYSAPFKDRTNRATVTTTDGNGQKSSNGISTTAVDKPKAKMLTDLAPPLNAARLKPIQQQTRTAKVS